MSVVVILLVVKFSRFLVKDKSKTLSSNMSTEGINTHSTTKLVNFSQLTTLLQDLVRI